MLNVYQLFCNQYKLPQQQLGTIAKKPIFLTPESLKQSEPDSEIFKALCFVIAAKKGPEALEKFLKIKGLEQGLPEDDSAIKLIDYIQSLKSLKSLSADECKFIADYDKRRAEAQKRLHIFGQPFARSINDIKKELEAKMQHFIKANEINNFSLEFLYDASKSRQFAEYIANKTLKLDLAQAFLVLRDKLIEILRDGTVYKVKFDLGLLNAYGSENPDAKRHIQMPFLQKVKSNLIKLGIDFSKIKDVKPTEPILKFGLSEQVIGELAKTVHEQSKLFNDVKGLVDRVSNRSIFDSKLIKDIEKLEKLFEEYQHRHMCNN